MGSPSVVDDFAGLQVSLEARQASSIGVDYIDRMILVHHVLKTYTRTLQSHQTLCAKRLQYFFNLRLELKGMGTRLQMLPFSLGLDQSRGTNSLVTLIVITDYQAALHD